MNSQLDRLAARLNAYRFSSADDRKRMTNDLYAMVFGQGQFYRELWDEPILLAIQDVVAEYPPKLFTSELEFLSKRTDQVVAINDFFASLLGHAGKDIPQLLERIANHLDIDREKVRLISISALSDLRRSNQETGQKLRAAVAEISQQLPEIETILTQCLEAVLNRQERGLAAGLLITERERIGGVLLVRVLLQTGVGQVNQGMAAEDIFNKSVDRARRALVHLKFLSANTDVDFSLEKTDAKYSGSSVALAASMAMYSSAKDFQFDPYTAFSGDIAIRDSEYFVLPVQGIPEKLAAAKRSGIRRVVLPRQNESDVPLDCNDLEIILVADIKEVLSALALPDNDLPVDTVQQRKSFLVREFCSSRGYQIAEHQIQKGQQFTITPPTSRKLIVSVYDTGTHTPAAADHRPEFNELFEQLDQCDSADTPVQEIKVKPFNILDAKLRKQIHEGFESLQPSIRKDEQYCDYSLTFQNGKEKLVVKQYSKGSLQLQGRAGPLYRRALEIIIPQYNVHYPNAALNIADYLSLDAPHKELTATTKTQEGIPLPHIGTDESGKGDYFGPLVIAGIWVDEALQNSLSELGVRDSKKLSDRQCYDLAAKIRELCQGKYQVVEISPERYNQLHDQFVQERKNLNHLLAWGHARAIEDILTRQSCNQAIADQFGDEKYIASKLMEKGNTINLLQTPKAERFIAVAAASVLARDRFLSRLSHLGNEAGVTLPKGASPAVIEAAKQMVQKQGPDALRKFAKLHFKTTNSVLAR